MTHKGDTKKELVVAEWWQELAAALKEWTGKFDEETGRVSDAEAFTAGWNAAVVAMTSHPGVRKHVLKTWPAPFEALLSLRKQYEIRKNDRDFAVGDFLILREWDPETQAYSGRQTLRLVTYMTPGGAWGLPPDLCVLSLSTVVGL